jgi:hypothetical protein
MMPLRPRRILVGSRDVGFGFLNDADYLLVRDQLVALDEGRDGKHTSLDQGVNLAALYVQEAADLPNVQHQWSSFVHG